MNCFSSIWGSPDGGTKIQHGRPGPSWPSSLRLSPAMVRVLVRLGSTPLLTRLSFLAPATEVFLANDLSTYIYILKTPCGVPPPHPKEPALWCRRLRQGFVRFAQRSSEFVLTCRPGSFQPERFVVRGVCYNSVLNKPFGLVFEHFVFTFFCLFWGHGSHLGARPPNRRQQGVPP